MFYQVWHKKTVDALTSKANNYPLDQESVSDNATNYTASDDEESTDHHLDASELLTAYNSVFDAENGEEAEEGPSWAAYGLEGDGSKNSTNDRNRIMALRKCMNKLSDLRDKQDKCNQSLVELEEKYNAVSDKTSSLHNACDQLMSQQTQLAAANEQIKSNLHHYQQYDWLMKKLQTSKLSLSGTLFTQILSTIHECITYLKNHSEENEAAIYLLKYEQCLSKSLTAIKAGVLADLQSCKDDVLYRQLRASNQQHNITTVSSSSSYVDDDTFALLYGVFGVKANTIRNAIAQAHQFFAEYVEYQTVVLELEHEYFQIREHLLRPIVNATIQQLCQRHSNSSCSLTRDGCTFLLRLCDDEFRLYKQFFVVDPNGDVGLRSASSTPKPMLPMSAESQYFWRQSCMTFDAFIDGLCRILYDTLRPLIIHNPHLETLAQLCSLLKVDMIEDRCGMFMQTPYGTAGHVGSNTAGMNTPNQHVNPRAGFARVMGELVGDIVERIVYRTSMFAQSDVLGYNPAPGDLAYPERLVMMNKDQSQNPAASEKTGPKPASTSAIDLHCLWYPTVRRTVMCLSKLYKCLDPAVFLSISKELLDACCQSLEIAAQRIRQLPIDPTKASVKSAGRALDAELFIVKHLLILREQTSPYHFPMTPQFDYSLDLSKYKNSMFQLLSSENRGRWFELSSNNAVLSFLLAAPVHVSEFQTDSRRVIEGHLKRYCHELIRFVTNLLIGAALSQLAREIESWENAQEEIASANVANSHQTLVKDVAKLEKLNPKTLNDTTSVAFKTLKQNWTPVRRAFSLYIGVKETEEILLQPIRKAVVNVFTNISVFTQKYYNEEQRQIASVPNQEQVWLLVNA
ncbi:sec34-like family domain-containing protein [Ditylenchus destructor]|uniref:Conserved oligomeric Golgi complex subunit 3 n=1 Tax=Ditylenchus destructor TaxID=166010 RepID=A0AAD4R2A9_9BILA|nr:sec34-like family domain-containing protein [Ditylenchus destructor]